MNNYAIEMYSEAHNQFNFLSLVLPPNELEGYLKSQHFKDRLANSEQMNFKPTGRVFIAQANSEKKTWSIIAKLPEGAQLHSYIMRKPVDILCFDLQKKEEATKQAEKALADFLKNQADSQAIGEVWGAFYDFTSSGRLPYSELYTYIKELLLKAQSDEGKHFCKILLEKEKEAKNPHKSSAKSLKYFELSKKEKELAKKWK